MKNKLKSIVGAVILFLITIMSAPSYSANPVVTIGTPTIAGSTMSVSVYVTGDNVGTCNFLIDYNHSALTYSSVISYSTIPNNLTVQDPYNYSGYPSQPLCKVNLNTGLTTYNYDDKLLFTLTFNYSSGSPNFAFVHIAVSPNGKVSQYTWVTQYLGVNPPPINYNTVFNNAPVTLYSDAASGGDWANVATWKTSSGSGPAAGMIPSGIVNTNITGAAVTVSADAKAQDLTINPAGKLTLNSGKALTVKGNMLIQSDVTGTGSYIDYGTTSVTGTTTAQRYMTGNWNHLWPANSDVIWHYVSTPVSGATINTFAGGLLNSWKEDTLSTGYWKPLTLPLTIPLAVSTGYAAAMPSTGIISYTGGTFNTGDKAINNLTNSDQSASRGYNLIGNAFPSAIAWNNLISRTNLDASAYLWTGSTYATYLTDDHHRIPSEQAFFVHVTVGHSTGSLVIPNTNRVHTDTVYAKSTASTRLDLTVTGNNLEDLTSIRFNNDATTGFDPEYDAYKLWGVTACPQIYCIATDNLSINSLPEYTDKTVIPIGFKFGVNDNYTITASKLETFPGGTQIYLVDRVLHVEQDLFANPVYTFAASIGNPGHRFDIQFSPLTGIPEGSVSNINIYSANKTVYINVPMDLHGQIIVYDLLGKEVANQSIESKTLNKVSLNSQPGYYLVKVFGDKATVSGKVFIQ